MSCNIAGATRLIEAADRLRSEVVLCLMGKPGIGKTESIERFAREHGRKVVHIIASQVLPNEVSGMTMPNQEARTMDVFDHVRLGHMGDGDILFLDELLKGQTQVLNACLTLIQERRMMSGRKLPDILIVAAANPLATPAKLPPEIRQRFMFVDMEWDKDEWMEYMKGKGFANEGSLFDMASLIEGSMAGDWSGTWNILTPRTATKLCEWYRETVGGRQDKAVRGYIGDAYGHEVAEAVSEVVDIDMINRRRAMDVIVRELGKLDAATCADVMKDIEDDIEGYVSEMSVTSLDKMMKRLREMDEWPEIERALAGEKTY